VCGVCDNLGIESCKTEADVTGGSETKKFWSGNEIREAFLRFFESKGHRRVRSSSLVPHGDPTLLFTNAGMNQFKDVFLGLEKRDYTRATSAQKCVRAGGKHNDLENVGFTKRHHTFFEMLGNFSFGDYFKKEAIAYAWELITSPDWFNIPKDKLYVTVFEQSEISPGQVVAGDHESLTHWSNTATGLPAGRIRLLGAETNFWAMGDTGPCGPCSEIHYDMGPAASEAGHTDCQFPCDCGRYVEIWNLVFMEFNRYCLIQEPGRGGLDEGTPQYLTPKVAEGVRQLEANHKHGPDCLRLRPLPKPSVDTGMGLERVAAVLQGVISNYDTDLFVPLMKRAAELCGVVFQQEEALEEGKGGAASLRVIADHARATTFLITDGVLPSNDGRGYVLRKIMRRAIYHGRLLGQDDKPFLYGMVDAVRDLMKDAYPVIEESAGRVSAIVKSEETRFAHTLNAGLGRWEDDLELSVQQIERPGQGDKLDRTQSVRKDEYESLRVRIPKLNASGQQVVYSGEQAFKLYDTFGLPRDFIEDLARDWGVSVDWPGFDKALQEQRTRTRASWKGGAKETANPAYAKLAEKSKTALDFYSGTTAKDSRIEAIITKSGSVNELKAGESGEVVLDRTAIYAESGGQVAGHRRVL